ncbi:MAG: inorganic diphosphatase [Candidatus Pacebacteria bacterium]|nr:inorganic diphosphatase [Candidatus Paceibacterota bacterium]
MNTLYYYFLESDKQFPELEEKLKQTLHKTEEKIISATEPIETDVVCKYDPQNTIPELGISGQHTKEAGRIDIFLDTKNEHLCKNLATEVARTLIHEYMHVVREKYVPWENGTLLDSLIAEGLSLSFETEMQPELPASIYATALTEREIADAWEKAKPLLEQRGFENDEWFFGGDEIKRWTGYSLGYKLVQDYLKATRQKASNVYKLPSDKFLLAQGVRDITRSTDFIGKNVIVKIDRPLHSKHPKHGFVYELNYGFIPDTISPDGEELDAYVMGVQEPLETFSGKCIAVIRRINDNDDKLIVVPTDSKEISAEEITRATHFQEQFFQSEIVRK